MIKLKHTKKSVFLAAVAYFVLYMPIIPAVALTLIVWFFGHFLLLIGRQLIIASDAICNFEPACIYSQFVSNKLIFPILKEKTKVKPKYSIQKTPEDRAVLLHFYGQVLRHDADNEITVDDLTGVYWLSRQDANEIVFEVRKAFGELCDEHHSAQIN